MRTKTTKKPPPPVPRAAPCVPLATGGPRQGGRHAGTTKGYGTQAPADVGQGVHTPRLGKGGEGGQVLWARAGVCQGKGPWGERGGRTRASHSPQGGGGVEEARQPHHRHHCHEVAIGAAAAAGAPGHDHPHAQGGCEVVGRACDTGRATPQGQPGGQLTPQPPPLTVSFLYENMRSRVSHTAQACRGQYHFSSGGGSRMPIHSR
jgi:hypothetical protein